MLAVLYFVEVRTAALFPHYYVFENGSVALSAATPADRMVRVQYSA